MVLPSRCGGTSEDGACPDQACRVLEGHATSRRKPTRAPEPSSVECRWARLGATWGATVTVTLDRCRVSGEGATFFSFAIRVRSLNAQSGSAGARLPATDAPGRRAPGHPRSLHSTHGPVAERDPNGCDRSPRASPANGYTGGASGDDACRRRSARVGATRKRARTPPVAAAHGLWPTRCRIAPAAPTVTPRPARACGSRRRAR